MKPVDLHPQSAGSDIKLDTEIERTLSKQFEYEESGDDEKTEILHDSKDADEDENSDDTNSVD